MTILQVCPVTFVIVCGDTPAETQGEECRGRFSTSSSLTLSPIYHYHTQTLPLLPSFFRLFSFCIENSRSRSSRINKCAPQIPPILSSTLIFTLRFHKNSHYCIIV